MASNAQVTPLGQTLNQFARRKAANAIELLGKSLPASVVSVRGAIVKVNFEVQSPFTIPQVTIPIIGSEYIRVPIQIGCKGFVVAADASLGGMTGLGAGVASLAPQPNLTALVFCPLGNAGWATVDGNVLVMYGPEGVTLRDQAATTTFVLAPGSITMDAGGHTLEISSAGVVIDGLTFGTHVHDAPSGGGDTGGPIPP